MWSQLTNATKSVPHAVHGAFGNDLNVDAEKNDSYTSPSQTERRLYLEHKLYDSRPRYGRICTQIQISGILVFMSRVHANSNLSPIV